MITSCSVAVGMSGGNLGCGGSVILGTCRFMGTSGFNKSAGCHLSLLWGCDQQPHTHCGLYETWSGFASQLSQVLRQGCLCTAWLHALSHAQFHWSCWLVQVTSNDSILVWCAMHVFLFEALLLSVAGTGLRSSHAVRGYCKVGWPLLPDLMTSHAL